jgi:hypothetical protein
MANVLSFTMGRFATYNCAHNSVKVASKFASTNYCKQSKRLYSLRSCFKPPSAGTIRRYNSVRNASFTPGVNCAFSPIYALSRTHLRNFKTASKISLILYTFCAIAYSQRMAFFRPSQAVTAHTASARGLAIINWRILPFFQYPFAVSYSFDPAVPFSLPLSWSLPEAPRPPASADRQTPRDPWLPADRSRLRVR